MMDRSAWRRAAVTALAGASAGTALLGMAGTASASPVPGTPITPASACVRNGGEVFDAAPGLQRCRGGGDTGDVVVSEEFAEMYGKTVPKPPVGLPSLPT